MTQDRNLSSIAQRALQQGRTLGEREAAQRVLLEDARCLAERFRNEVVRGVENFQQGLRESGSTHLCDESLFSVSPLELDTKHIRAVGFSVQRGRYKICIVVKTKGSVTLVGPFHLGKKEGPCRKFSIPTEERALHEFEEALADLLSAFFEEAMTT